MEASTRRELEKRWSTPGEVAWPTVALAAFVAAAFSVNTGLALAGQLPALPAMAVNVVLGYLAFTPAHEAGHGNLAGRVASARPLEALVGHAMMLILHFPYPFLRYMHLQHHSHTNDPELDPDMRARGRSLPALLFHCLTVEVGYVVVARRLLAQGKRGARQAVAASLPALLLAAAAYGYAALHGVAGRLALLWAVPALLSLGCLALVFDWLPHYPHDSRERYRDTRVMPGALLNVLLLGQNYHLLHHLYPRLPFYRYRACFAAVRPILQQERSPMGFGHTLLRAADAAPLDEPATQAEPR